MKAVRTFQGSPPGDAYPHRAPEALGLRRRGRQGHFLAGVVCATTGLGLSVKVLPWLSPHDIPWSDRCCSLSAFSFHSRFS